MIYFLTYGDNKFKESKRRIRDEAIDFNIFDKVIVKSNEDLAKDLPKITIETLKLSRGGGYWLWKPIIIKNLLDTINDDDIIVYSDAGSQFNNNIEAKNRFNEYINMVSNKEVNKPIICFKLDNIIEYTFTNSTILKYFNVFNNTKITHSCQITTCLIILRKSEIIINIINQWYNIAIHEPLLFTDNYNNIDIHPDFKDNRHDQSVYSIICKLYIDYINLIDDETWPYNKKNPISARRIRN
jgi:hypothetical protein